MRVGGASLRCLLCRLSRIIFLGCMSWLVFIWLLVRGICERLFLLLTCSVLWLRVWLGGWVRTRFCFWLFCSRSGSRSCRLRWFILIECGFVVF